MAYMRFERVKREKKLAVTKKNFRRENGILFLKKVIRKGLVPDNFSRLFESQMVFDRNTVRIICLLINQSLNQF